MAKCPGCHNHPPGGCGQWVELVVVWRTRHGQVSRLSSLPGRCGLPSQVGIILSEASSTF